MYRLGEVCHNRRRDVDAFPDLTRLADRLDKLLADIQRTPIAIPSDKALLSQDGGICAKDGSRLVFDPFAPAEHRCGVCGAVYAGPRHHRAWVWRYHLWLSERVIHAALLAAVGRSEARNLAWCSQVLEGYVMQYASYPNVDNVLGPTRLFFSTYLESIWLLQLIIASMMMPDGLHSKPSALIDSLKSVVVESSDLIASFDERLSNRQVWNAAAVLAAGLFLDDERRVDMALSGPSGICSLLTHGVAANGRWHEGENYHLFALRGFTFAAELASLCGRDLYAEYDRLSRMFAAPLSTMLPDFTLAARGDSPYGVSIRQPRFAELWEIGFARTGDERLAAILQEIYQTSDEQPEIGITEIAELEQNRTAMKIDRTGLGWKALLWMHGKPVTGQARNSPPPSVVVEPHGPVVMRTTDGRYVAVEGSGTGSGHGHPDRMHLTLFDRGPVLMDFGTGSYVDQSLHWYRSWLCHNVPERRGGDGRVGQTRLVAFDQVSDWQWCRVELTGFAGRTSLAERNVLVCPEYVVDIVRVDVTSEVVIDLPLHVLEYDLEGWLPGGESSAERVGYGDLVGSQLAETSLVLSSNDRQRGEIFIPGRDRESLFVVHAPGPPPLTFGQAPVIPFLLRRCAGPGVWVQVFARRPDYVRHVHVADEITVVTTTGSTIVRSNAAGIEIEDNAQRVRLAGVRTRAHDVVDTPAKPSQRFICHVFERAPSPDDIEIMVRAGNSLEGPHYRRSELPYRDTDRFSAKWTLYAVGRRVVWIVDVRKADLYFRPPNAENPKLDNEHPDIHSDGVQIYFGDVFAPDAVIANLRDTWRGFLVVPDENEGTGCRLRSVDGFAARGGDLEARVTMTDRGYRMVLSTDVASLPRSGDVLPFDLVVNEMYRDRERRAGQLALGGGGWVYLRGDLESPSDASWCVFQ